MFDFVLENVFFVGFKRQALVKVVVFAAYFLENTVFVVAVSNKMPHCVLSNRLKEL